jgi:hypothetical protein
MSKYTKVLKDALHALETANILLGGGAPRGWDELGRFYSKRKWAQFFRVERARIKKALARADRKK